MGSSDYNQDVGPGLRTGITASQLQQAHDRAVVEKSQNEAWGAYVATGIILLAVVAGHYIVQHRRKIARAAETALIAGLSTGVRTARAAASKKDALVARVLAKADEPPTKRD